MSKQMVTLKLDPKKATLQNIVEQLQIPAADIDPDFGVVNIDPQANLYAILVEEESARKLSGTTDVSGPFSNPRIEPFGPPKRSPKT